MRPKLSLLQRLAALDVFEIVERRSDAVLIAAVLQLGPGRRLLAIERTYRFGLKLIVNPSAAEIDSVTGGDLWDLWNSERCEPVDFVV